MLKRIISGGQTGADQGGLEAAVALGLETGGYIPRGYRTEDGSSRHLRKYNLRETNSSTYPPRTILNVEESDGTVWFGNTQSPGAKLTIKTVKRLRKPLHIYKKTSDFSRWLKEKDIEILNVAGNRESKNPGIQEMTKKRIVRSVRFALD